VYSGWRFRAAQDSEAEEEGRERALMERSLLCVPPSGPRSTARPHGGPYLDPPVVNQLITSGDESALTA